MRSHSSNSHSQPLVYTPMNETIRQNLTTTAIHIMAFDGIVSVNSLFTLATFLGLAANPSDPTYSLVDPTSDCAAGSAVADRLVAFHVYSFGSFLFSSLVASALKLAIRTTSGAVEQRRSVAARVNLRAMRAGILASAAGSVSGCVFLTLALSDLVQVKLGALSCRSWYGLAAVGSLVVLVPPALVMYIFIVLHAFSC